MKKESLKEKVKSTGLKNTPLREEVLKIFTEAKKALSSKDIIEKLGKKYDRVSIFRTISTFAENGVIHAIPTSSDYVVYSLCRDNCATAEHLDHHYHFFCRRCGNIFCLNDFEFYNIKLPRGYKAEGVNILFEGVCKDCNKN